MNIERSVAYFSREIGRYFVEGNCFSRCAGRLFAGMGLLTSMLIRLKTY